MPTTNFFRITHRASFVKSCATLDYYYTQNFTYVNTVLRKILRCL
nr:MAG TPA: hypothetical protein [Caudoviricetes sp.]